MIDRLIHAYRSKIYDFSLAELFQILKAKWKVMLACLVSILAILSGVGCSLYFNQPIIMHITIIAELILFAIGDAYLVKQFKLGIVSEKSRLEKVSNLLQFVFPGTSLYTASQIDVLINRLSERIASQKPFHSFFKYLFGFLKYITVPIISFVAGAFSDKMQELGLAMVIGYALAIMVVLAVFYVIFIFFSPLIKRITNRDYYAAIALCEDLKDIKLLYFSSSSIATK